MTTPQLLVLLLVVVVAVVLVWLLVRRSAARKDGARAEAAGLRAEAEGVAGTLAGQETFAEQAEDRAGLARAEADRLAAEASGYRETVEVTRTDHRSMLARADEVDPDVESSDASEDERRPMTRAEARQMREEAERAAWAGSPAAPVPGAAGAAVMSRDGGGGVVRGPAVEEPEVPVEETEPVVEADAPVAQEPAVEVDGPVAEQPVAEDGVDTDGVVEEPGADESTPLEDPAQEPEGDPASEERSARIAAATDYRDGDDADEPEVWDAAPVGTGEGMDEQPDADESTQTAATDAQAPPGEWGGPHVDGADEAPATTSDQPTEADTTTEPEAEPAADSEATDGDPEPAEEPEQASVEGPGAAGFVEDEEPGAEDTDAYDPTPERDWSADEGELLAETSDRADELAAEREQMDRDAAAVGMEPVHPEVVEQAEHEEHEEHDAPAGHDEEPDSTEEGALEDESALDGDAAPVEQPVADGEDAAPLVDEPEAEATDTHDAASEAEPADVDDASDTGDAVEEPARTPRRISEFHEIRDGGYGMGSAAAIDDGAQPMDHPVQGYRDTMTYRVPGDPGYDEAEAHVWFYDAAAAERSGFHRSEG